MDTVIVAVVIICVIGVLLLARILFNLRALKQQLDYINQEIARSSPKELPYWKEQRRKLWRSFFRHPL